MAHWIDDTFELKNRVLGCWLYEGDSESQTLWDKFIEEMFKECKFPNGEIVAVVYNNTSNTKKFGILLEKLDILQIYCTDHVLQLMAENAYVDSWHNRAVSGVENDADDLNMSEVVELPNMEKVGYLV